MSHFSPASLEAWTGGRWSREPTRPITGFAIDSRRVRPGDCFVALQTARRDGHDFVAAAREAGAAAVIVARAAPGDPAALVVEDPEKALQDCARGHRRRFRGPVVGITGSAGKTSTKEMLHLFLGPARTLATEGNLNNHLGVPLTLLRLDPARHDRAVIEAGINRRGEMALLAGIIEPAAAIVTTVALAHADGIGDLEAIATEKAQLPAAVPAEGLVLFPARCARHAAFAAFAATALQVRETAGTPSPPYLYFQTKPHAGETQTPPARTNEPTREAGVPGNDLLEIRFPDRPPLVLTAPPLSDGMRENLVLAAVLASRLGVTDAALRERLADWRPAPQRGEIREAGNAIYYVDCYNANPAAMIDAIRFFARRFAPQPRLYVLGSMNELGPFAESAHESVGAAVELGKEDRAVLIGPFAPALWRGLQTRGATARQVEQFATTAEAAPAVLAFTGAVLLKGSRSYGLETLLPGAPEVGGEAARAC